MSSIQIQFDEEVNGFSIASPEHFEGRIKLSIPEFHGKLLDKRFAIKQSLETVDSPGGPGFKLDTDPSQIGIRFTGSFEPDPAIGIRFNVELTNTMDDPIETGHHTFVLDVSETPELGDPDNERTLMYTETGWETLAHMSNEPGLTVNRMHRPFNIGAAYNYTTIMWRTIARTALERDTVIALAISRGYTFASDHELYPNSMLGGCRWGTVKAHETQENTGRIYIITGGLDTLRDIYNTDFKKGQ